MKPTKRDEENMAPMNDHHRGVYMEKLSQKHEGPCSSQRMADCPCQHICPLHGRCCDCLHHHKEHQRVRQDKGTEWLPACMKLLCIPDAEAEG